MEMFKIIDPTLYRMVVRNIKRFWDTEKFEIYPTIGDAKIALRAKIKKYRQLDSQINKDDFYL